MFSMKYIILITSVSIAILLGILSIYYVYDSNPTSSEPFDTSMIDDSSIYGYEIVAIYPHNTTAYTQGFTYQDGIIFEGTGLYGHSSIRKVNLTTGEIIKIKNLSHNYFGEGITIFNDSIFQLTWKSKLAFVYDKLTLIKIRNYSYDTEGWGITHDGQNLIMSDGTSLLYFLDPETFENTRTVQVTYKEKHVTKINELEYINGEIFANIWPSNYIAKINPFTGNIIGWIDLEGLLEEKEHSKTIDVLNGIAFNEKTNNLLLTGKFWPYIFEIRLTTPPKNQSY